MTVTTVDKDPMTCTMCITAEYDAPAEQVWRLWSDPRLLEQWWGPPTWPATFDAHDLTPGGWMAYYMTGPEGDKARGWWRVLALDPPHRLEFEDGFAGDDGTPNPDMPTMVMRVAITDAGAVTRMSVTTTFPTTEAMDQMVSMGMDEGMAQAMGQIDGILAGVVSTQT